jgi:hypothetical protein
LVFSFVKSTLTEGDDGLDGTSSVVTDDSKALPVDFVTK